MASFVDVEDAVKCSIAVQKAFTEHNQHHPHERLHIRVGLSAGEPVEENGDFFGSTVQLAARICAYAEPDHILSAQIIHDECQSYQNVFVEVGKVTLKGFDHPISVHEVRWQ